MNLVTGANGLVGSYLCRYLLQKGESVCGLKRKNSDMRLVSDIQDKIEWIEGDILDIVSLEDALRGADNIYHCAALISYNKKDRDALFSINSEGTANVVNAALISDVKKFLYISSIAAIGRKGIENETITENTPWDSANATSDYSLSKFSAEREVWRGIAEGLNAVIINPSVILGAGNWNAGSSKLFQTAFSGFKFYTEGITGYVDVRDVVKIAYELMQSDITGERFIVSGENISYKELFFSIADAMHKKHPPYKAGKFLSELAWRSEALKSMLTGKAPAIMRSTARIANRKVYFDNAKIKAALQYEFIPIMQTIRETSALFLKDAGQNNFSYLEF